MFSSIFISAKERLISSGPVEFKEAFIPQEVPYKSTITYEELLEDLDMTVYYLETVYAGYDTMKKNGFDAQNFKKTISKKYNNDEIIDTQRVFVDILEKLQGYVKDRHLSVVKNQDDNNFEIGNTTDSNLFFHTNVYLEKINSEFYVQESENIELLKGTKYTGSKENLFYYPVKGTNSYILGLIAKKNPNVFQFSFGNKEISLNTYDDGNINSSKAIKYHELETKNSGYVSISSFYMPDVNSQYYKGANLVFNKYANLFQKWNSKKNIIIDLRGNSGGLSEFHEYLIYSMFQKNPKEYSDKNYEKCYSWFCKNSRLLRFYY